MLFIKIKLRSLPVLFSESDIYLNRAESKINVILKVKWHHKLFIKDTLYLLLNYIDYINVKALVIDL